MGADDGMDESAERFGLQGSGMKGGPLLRGVSILVGIGLGGMLVAAALLKAADPSLFVQQIRGYEILPALAPVAAVAFIWAEVVIGSLLLFRIVPRAALLAFIALMLVFIAATAYTWSRGNVEGCGCFGRLASRPPGAVILEDSIYLLLAGAALPFAPWRTGRGAARSLRLMAGLVFAALLLSSPWAAPRMPVDRWVTPLRPGVSVESMAADDLRVPLGEGRLFLALMGPDCAACVDALPVLDRIAQTEGAPRVTAIFVGDRRAARAWMLEHVPAFPVANAPARTMRQYYRKLPVFLLVEEGVVRKLWYGTPPEPEQIPRAAGVAAR